MEDYPAHYIAHNVPLILLSGLGTPDPNAFDEIEQQYALLQDGGIRISSDLPDVTGQTAEDLLDCFQEFDAVDATWNNRPGRGKLGSMGFTYRSVGRSILLPPHKERPPSSLTDLSQSEGPRTGPSTLHSPISPLSTSSPLHPDGVMTPMWFTKHQLLLPAALVLFFALTLDHHRITLEDNRLKSEINSIKSNLAASGYKTRFVVVLVSESDKMDPSLPERIANLRRATSLDAKTLFHLPGYTTPVELRAFVGNMLAAMYTNCIEYYRDLSKHARRKRNRGSTPASTASLPPGTEAALSLQGWTVRYETKMGTFAEFRAEMDAAGRSYEVAYETLLDREVLESLAFGSTRFSEARILADILAFRIIRCLLWTGQTTSAVQSWLNHRMRIRDLIERKSDAIDSYGWYAWDARWSKMMAELVDKVDLAVFYVQPEVQSPGSINSQFPMIYAIPEKNLSAESRLAPWEYLHHQGYWLSRSATAIKARKASAQNISPADQQDHTRTGEPAQTKPRFDLFLCPPPGEEVNYDHSATVIRTLEAAARQFILRDQPRASEKARLDIGLEHIRKGQWQEATDILRPLWQTLSWRQAQWWDLVSEVSSAIKLCAANVEDWEMYLAAEWELSSNLMSTVTAPSESFHACLDKFQPSRRPHASLHYDNLAPTFTANFSFSRARGNAGVQEPAQLTVSCQTQSNASPIILTEIHVSIEGNIKAFKLGHEAHSKPAASIGTRMQYFDLGVPETSGTTQSANLEFHPGQSKVFLFKLIPREAGDVQASSATLVIKAEGFKFDIAIPLCEQPVTSAWWVLSGDALIGKRIPLERACSLTVLPKPPKLKLSVPSFKTTYYVDELVDLGIQLVNEEGETADVKLNITLSSPGDSVPKLRHGTDWSEDDSPILQQSASRIEDYHIGQLTNNAIREEDVSFKALAGFAELFLVVRADYFLLSDPETPVTVIFKEKLSLVTPLELNCTFLPRVGKQPWPSYFVPEEDSNAAARGLWHEWGVAARLSSFALHPLVIEDATLEVVQTKYGVACKVKSDDGLQGVALPPDESSNATFELCIQKDSLDDRRSALVSFQLKVVWHREDERSKSNTTTLLVPSLTVSFGEPRVLCSAQPSAAHRGMVNVAYVLENPSSHLLSFSVTMETSDEFAFSGPKAQLLQLVPLSRTEIRFNLMSFQQGVWIHPYLRVTDTGFGQELKIQAAEGCRNEKKAIAIWIDAE